MKKRWGKNANHLVSTDDETLSLQIKYIPHGAIVIPGMSGANLSHDPDFEHRSDESFIVADSHAHMLEFGANQQLPLEAAKNSKGLCLRFKSIYC